MSRTPKGRWIDHRQARIVCQFGVPGPWAAGHHTGVDIAVPGSGGQKIVWALKNPGTVLEVGWPTSAGSAYGRSALIRGHGGKVYLFAHMGSTPLRPGQKVHNGDKIGTVGSTGNVTGPHLHLEKSRGHSWVYGQTVKPPVFRY